MAFDQKALAAAVAAHGRVARVVVAEVRGSAPREAGAAMLVWATGQSGTIGGGALEWAAARAALGRTGLTRHALGPDLGQCCGGSVTLLTEHYTAADLPVAAQDGVFARGPGPMPFALRRLFAGLRAGAPAPAPHLVGDWMVEPMAAAGDPVWIWGAGHVGRALVDVLSPLPDCALSWIDTGPERFPDPAPAGVDCLPGARPAAFARHAPPRAAHIVATYSHALDLEICDALLRRGFGFAGVIGSDTKWARFRRRLSHLGHDPAEIARIRCPIGQKSLGRHPQAIALGVAVDLLNRKTDRNDATCPNRFSASGV